MDPTAFWLQQRMRSVEQQAASGLARIRQARTLSDVVRAADVHVPAELRALRHQLSGLRQLQLAAERRLEELLAEQLRQLKATAEGEREAHRLRLLREEWSALRGTWAAYYRKAEADSLRIVRQPAAGPASD